MTHRAFPLQLTTNRPADMGLGTLPSRDLHPALMQYLEPSLPTLPWWNYPGVRAHIALQPHMTPHKLEALFALAGRTDEGTLAEVAHQYHTRPERLLRWHQATDQEIRQWLARVMEDIAMPQKPRPTIQMLRKRRALSLQALAAVSGLSLSTIFRAEHSLPIRPSSKQQLAAALKMRPEEIRWEVPHAHTQS